jgi:hypothetical protein
MNKDLAMNLFIFIIFCVFVYFIFSRINMSSYKEGMTKNDNSDASSSANGIAGNAATYAATIKEASVKLQDTFLISKYRTDYETTILNLDELINNLMLKAALTANKENPDELVKSLAAMNQAKAGLNSVMKFIDSSK